VTHTYGPTIAKRRLSRRLMELRLENGYTANQVCDKLNWGRGKVGRFEANNWKRPDMSDVRDLLRIYKVSEDEREDLQELAMHARARAWWREYGDVFGDSEYPGWEADATRIQVYMPLVLPGLLQTPTYMEAQMGVGYQPPAWRERAREARLRRQQVLNREGDISGEVIAVITEASLLYLWGTQAERRGQVAHLVEMSLRPNIDLRVLRFANGPHPGMCGPITVFDFPGDEPSVVCLETDFEIQEVSDKKDIKAYIEIFRRAREAALDPAATRAYLEQLSETLE